MSRVVLESPSAAARVDRAAAWLAARQEPHVTIVAASIEAAAEVARRAITSGSGGARASLGWQRTTLGAMARPSIVSGERHFASGRPCASVYLPVTMKMMSTSVQKPKPPHVTSCRTPKSVCPV